MKQKVTLGQLSQLFDMKLDTPEVLDTTGLGLKVQSMSGNGDIEYKEVREFLVKQKVNEYYSLGKLNGTGNHRVKLGDTYVKLRDHPDALKVNGSMDVVDISVADNENYIANGQVNHNTTSGGWITA